MLLTNEESKNETETSETEKEKKQKKKIAVQLWPLLACGMALPEHSYQFFQELIWPVVVNVK